MRSWFKNPLVQKTTAETRIRLYIMVITLTTVSVPFLHMYMEAQLSYIELATHTLSVALSVTVAILLLELVLRVFSKGKTEKKISTGVFWLLLLIVFTLSLITMAVTHNLLPVTLAIWNKHINPDIVATPWKIFPIVLVIGYILILFIRRCNLSQELADLKDFNEQLQLARSEANTTYIGTDQNQYLDQFTLVVPYKGENLYLNPKLLIRVESNENYCHILAAPGETQNESNYMVRITLTEIANQLPQKTFLQVHRSHIVNINYVSSLCRHGRNYRLQMTNGDYVPASRSRLDQIRQKIRKGSGDVLHR